jgi:heme a synthase
MNSHPTLDLAPIGVVALVGLALALVPVAWLWRRQRRDGGDWRLRLTLLTAFLTFDLVVFGAFTRLTDSGLGCPDWPGCYGTASPAHAHAAISTAQAALPSGPVTHGKAWIEMIHRYLATAVGALILLLAILAQRAGRAGAGAHRPSLGRALPWLTLVWVCIQGAFGALTVTMKLFPAIVTLHLLGGMVLLAMLVVQCEVLSRAARPGLALSHTLRKALAFGLGVLGLQIALGGWVSTNYAVLACRDFPLCQGQWWPVMDFDAGFSLWRPLGLTAGGESIAFPALTAIHMTHRLVAVVVALVLGALAIALWRVQASRAAGRLLAGLLLLQLASGTANVVLGWPLLAALAHTAGAAAMVGVLTWLWSAVAPRDAAVRSGAVWQGASA